MKILSTRKLGFLPGGIREDYEVHARGGAARDGVGNCSAKADITDQVIFTVNVTTENQGKESLARQRFALSNQVRANICAEATT